MSDELRIAGNLRQPLGVCPFLQPAADLPTKRDVDTNSWFCIGHFEADGHTLNFLYHIFTAPGPNGKQTVTSALAFTNQTTGAHFSGVASHPIERAQISADTFSIIVPDGSMSGSLDEMQIKAHIPEGAVNLVMKPFGHVLYNGGTGFFPMLGMDVHQYSVPTMETTGTLTMEGHTYNVSGISWFDRQWQNLSPSSDGKPLNGKWAWMDLNLDNGDRISLWSAQDATGAHNSWVTILHPDGNQTVTAIDSLSAGESNYWTSPTSGKRYPTRWIVTIPAFDAKLEVEPYPQKQELVPNQVLAYYEAASSVRGAYKGKETTGYCYVELVGDWK